MANQIKTKDVVIHAGDLVKVHYSFKEKGKKKSQLFEGIVLSIKGKGENKSFTVRKVTRSKIGVERIFPVASPFIDKIDIIKPGKVRRSKVYFVRDKSEREIRDRLYS
ncbi:MAG: 50S ribosomal protein L19 [Candidatus Paceibacterota bacterium]